MQNPILLLLRAALVHGSRSPSTASVYSRVLESPMTAFKRSQAKYVRKSYKTTNCA